MSVFSAPTVEPEGGLSTTALRVVEANKVMDVFRGWFSGYDDPSFELSSASRRDSCRVPAVFQKTLLQPVIPLLQHTNFIKRDTSQTDAQNGSP
jgi:hypothetical protein